jgi:hypothetical protein
MAVRKLPMQSISFKGELKDFIYVSIVEPGSASFFTAFGICLLESLIRLKSCPEITQQTWNSLKSLIFLSKVPAKKLNFVHLHDKFTQLISDITLNNRRNAMNLLDKITNTDAICIDYGIRFILLAMGSPVSIIKGKIRNYESVLGLLSQKLCVNLFVVVMDKYKTIKASSNSPLICLYEIEQGNFALIYHLAAKYLDEKPDPVHIDPFNFPFTDPSIPIPDPKEQLGSVLDLISFLSMNIQSLPPDMQSQLKLKIEAAAQELPGILAITNLPKLAGDTVESFYSPPTAFDAQKTGCKDCMDRSIKCYCANTLGYTQRNQSSQPRSVSIGTRPRPNMSASLRTQESPLNRAKSTCSECGKTGDSEEYNLIPCKKHQICLRCRAKKATKGNFKCSQCSRDYLPEEKALLSAMNII